MSIAFILSAPSGCGKTTLARKLLARDERLEFAVSVTTRPRRGAESDGREYRFVSEEQFVSMRDRGELIEWAAVFGHYYGTPWSAVDVARSHGRDLLLDIDVQGAASLRERLPDAVRIFILPPSRKQLGNRLRGRASDEPEVVRRRLRESAREVAEYRFYNYVVVNDRLEEALERLQSIISAERSRRERMERALRPILKGFGIERDARTEVTE